MKWSIWAEDSVVIDCRLLLVGPASVTDTSEREVITNVESMRPMDERVKERRVLVLIVARVGEDRPFTLLSSEQALLYSSDAVAKSCTLCSENV